MCGIVGIIHKNKQDVQEQDVRNMCSTIVHRGPDDEGVYVQGHAGIGMRRLSIIDIQSGHQPIHNEDASLWIVMNGEIYNYRELRKNLVAKGHVFYTESDTEVVLHLYEQEGERCLEKLRGMFSFAIYEPARDRMFLARDRLGIKPLFFHETADRILFASELKVILSCKGVSRAINWRAFHAFFAFSYIPAPLTIFQGIYKLLPGHCMMIQSGKIRLEQYWDLQFMTKEHHPEQYYIERFQQLFDEAVKMHMVSDVPIGAFLSGGVDSSSVVAMMSRHHPSVETLSIGFGGNIGAYGDERDYARAVSRRFGTRHREYEVHAEQCDGDLIEKIVTAFDEPFADHGTIPNYFVCQLARENMTVALSGLGGDELFSGYPRHLGFALSEFYSRFPVSVRKALPWFIEKLPESRGGEVRVNWLKRFVRAGWMEPEKRYLTYFNVLGGYSPQDLFSAEVLHELKENSCEEEFYMYYRSENASDPRDKVAYTDIKTYLPDDILTLTDRVSMMHSLEVRVPFLDHTLVEFCATIPQALKMKYFRPKYMLKKAMHGVLPDHVLNHKKQGFVSPMNVWLGTSLRGYVQETLRHQKLGFFRPEAITHIVDQHHSGKQLNTSLIWALLMFTLWHKKYLQ
ncbi:MAG: asparagine synthase (glutamine-hydrolyzing) [Nitrospirota bacterium]